MKTRKALEILSKGEVKYEDRSNGDMKGRSAHFLEMFEERERAIIAKRNENSVPLPFLETIKRKVAKMVSAPNNDMPVVTRFDIYTGIRKLAERAPADTGLTRLAKQLERAWHEEPLGTLTYGNVSGLVSLYKDQYPRSKAADAIEAECTRVGMHKLPVAKLARIASAIASQSDYDAAMESHGYAGDRPEQVRARALVRELVALRGAEVQSHEPSKLDTRDLGERLASRLEAQMVPPVPMEEEMPLDEMAPDMGMDAPQADMPIDPMMDSMPGVQEQDVAQGVNIVEDISDAAEEIVQEAPPEAMDYIDHEMAEGHTAPPGTAEWGAEEILNEGHEFPPPSDGWLDEEMAELGMDDMGGEMPMVDEMPMDDGPMMPVAAKGKGIPLPGKIKQQPNADSPEKVDVPKDGGQALKAEAVEQSVLDGETVKVGSVSIFVNDNMEVELWHKGAGRACDLEYLDVAIADFINLASDEMARTGTIKFAYSVDPLVHVPCGACATVTLFPMAKSASDEYGCECGHTTSAQSVAMILKVAQMQKAFQLQVAWNPPQDPNQAKLQRDRIMRAVQTTTGGVKVEDEGRGFFTATLWNVDEHQIQKLEAQMKQLGGQPESKRVAALIKQAQKWRSDPKFQNRTEIKPTTPAQGRDLAESMDTSKTMADVKPGDVVVAVRPIKDGKGNVVVPEGAKIHILDVGANTVTISDSAPMAEEAPAWGGAKNVSAPKPMPKDVKKDENGIPLAEVVKPEQPKPEQKAAAKTLVVPKMELANVRKTTEVTDMPSKPGMFSTNMQQLKQKMDMANKNVKSPSQTRQVDDPTAPKMAQVAEQPLPPPGGPLAPPPPAAPAAPAQNNQNQNSGNQGVITDMPMQEVIAAAMKNYKAQGFDMPKALRTFFKEHGDLVEARWSQTDGGTLVALLQEMFTSAQPGGVSQPGVDSPAPSMQATAQKVLEPKVTKKKTDEVSVGSKPLGKDTSQDDGIPSPGKIKQQQGKPDGKLSDTNLGPDSSSKEWSEPKPAKSTPNKGKLPNTDLGTDSSVNEAFKTPGLGSKPSVSKKK